MLRGAIVIAAWFACAHAAAQAPQLLLVETHATGVDPVVGRFVDRALRRETEALGYAVLPAGEDVRALQALQLTYPPSMADLWRVLQRSQAERAVSALAWAEQGRYVVNVRVACRDGSGPFYAQGQAGAEDLEAVSAALLRQALPPAASAAPAPSAEPAFEPEPATPALATPVATAPAQPAPKAEPPQFFAGSAAPVTAAGPRVRVAVREELALGLARDSFINDVIGARVDLGLSDTAWLGAHLGYANLAGRAGRVHSVLPYVQLEQRIRLGSGQALALPLRFAAGYLVRNGAFLRVSSGLAVPLGGRSELALDLLAPTFWSTPDALLFSLDLGLELNVTLQ